MQWDRLFEDLETQLESEWEAERAALDAESERLRIARLDLRTRLRGLLRLGAPVRAHLVDGERVNARVRALGADWVGLQAADAAPLVLTPLLSLTALETDQGALLDTLEEHRDAPGLQERMTLGFVLRDLARRRTPVRLSLADRTVLHGTVDRAAADHLDIAVHDAGAPRRAASVHGYRLVPLAAVVWLRTDALAL